MDINQCIRNTIPTDSQLVDMCKIQLKQQYKRWANRGYDLSECDNIESMWKLAQLVEPFYADEEFNLMYLEQVLEDLEEAR
jgi:hypothetical protein